MSRWVRHAQIDELSMDDIQQILDVELNKPAEKIDMALVKKCLLALAPESDGRAPNKAENWMAIQARLSSRRRRMSAYGKRLHPARKRMPMVSLVAWILVMVLVLATTVAYALGIDVWAYIVQWNDEEFHVSIRQEGALPVADKAELSPCLGAEFVSELNRYGMTPRLPHWLPERFELSRVEVDGADQPVTTIVALYTGGGDTLLIEVTRYDFEDAQLDLFYEKDERPYETYEQGGRTYYIIPNLERTTCMWLDEPYEIAVIGKLGSEELKQMFDSII